MATADYLSLQILADLDEIIVFLKAFFMAYKENGVEFLREKDAERIENNIDDVLPTAAFLKSIRDEHVVKAAGRGDNEHRIIHEACCRFSRVLQGSGANALIACLEKFLEREFSGKFSLGHRPVSTLLALKSVDRLIGILTIGCKNSPKAPITQYLVMKGIFEEKRDRSPEFPSVDTKWAQMHDVLSELISFYEEKIKGKKEERG